ncbi:hypothetical protein ACWJKU_12975 [Methylocaldum sp. MU1018]
MKQTGKALAVFLGWSLLNLPAPAEERKSPPAPAEIQGGEQEIRRLKETQEYLLKMHDLMHRIRDAKTDEERERLKLEHLKLLQIRMSPRDSGIMPEHIQELMEQGADIKDRQKK